MRILIVDQCSKAKDIPSEHDPLDADRIDTLSREQLLEEEPLTGIRARDLYAGRQQTFVSQAVDRLRQAGDEVRRVFISAGFGLVDESTPLPPYDVTFTDCSDAEIEKRAASLNIPGDVAALLSQDRPYDIAFFPLGEKYYRSMALESLLDDVPEQTTVVLFNQEGVVDQERNAVSLPARNGEAKRMETIVVALKGQYLKHFAEHRSEGRVVESPGDIIEACTTEMSSQSGLGDFE